MSAERFNLLSIIGLALAVIMLAIRLIRQSDQCISDPVPRAFVDKPCGADVTWQYGYFAMRYTYEDTAKPTNVHYLRGLWCGDHAQLPVGDHP